ncbi:MAG: DUF3185 family protein [Chlamydiota bacterium]
MNFKKLSGFILIAIGIVLIVFAIQSMDRISSRKHQVGMFSRPLSKVSGGDSLSGVLKGETEKYDTQVILILIGGIVCVVLGSAVAWRHYRHRR